jgi:hypothetical protein
MPLPYSLFSGKLLVLTIKYDLSEHQANWSMIFSQIEEFDNTYFADTFNEEWVWITMNAFLHLIYAIIV